MKMADTDYHKKCLISMAIIGQADNRSTPNPGTHTHTHNNLLHANFNIILPIQSSTKHAGNNKSMPSLCNFILTSAKIIHVVLMEMD